MAPGYHKKGKNNLPSRGPKGDASSFLEETLVVIVMSRIIISCKVYILTIYVMSRKSSRGRVVVEQ